MKKHLDFLICCLLIICIDVPRGSASVTCGLLQLVSKPIHIVFLEKRVLPFARTRGCGCIHGHALATVLSYYHVLI